MKSIPENGVLACVSSIDQHSLTCRWLHLCENKVSTCRRKEKEKFGMENANRGIRNKKHEKGNVEPKNAEKFKKHKRSMELADDVP